jgi:hypothetical protein
MNKYILVYRHGSGVGDYYVGMIGGMIVQISMHPEQAQVFETFEAADLEKQTYVRQLTKFEIEEVSLES